MAFVGNSPVKSPHKGPVTRKMFPFDDVIMIFQKTNFATREVRLDLDLSKARTYCEIDAIKMVGTDETAGEALDLFNMKEYL